MEDWALNRHLHLAGGISEPPIAHKLELLSRNTAVKAVGSSSPRGYQCKPVVNAFATLESEVRALVEEYPRMPATRYISGRVAN